MKKALLDTSSAIFLFKAGLLQELTDVYLVFATGSVIQELTAKNRQGTETFQQYVILKRIRKVESTENSYHNRGKSQEEMFSSLHKGEYETIKCFTAGNYDFIITDDGRAARNCKANGRPFINALLFPRLLYFSDRLSLLECNSKQDRIIDIGRYSAEVVEWARNCKKESLLFAIP